MIPPTYIDTILPDQPPEKFNGNKEYKLFLSYNNYKSNKKRQNYFDKKATQMLFRLLEGEGKAVYLIGVGDDGTSNGVTENKLMETLKVLQEVSKIINATIQKVRIYKSKNNLFIMSVRINLYTEHV